MITRGIRTFDRRRRTGHRPLAIGLLVVLAAVAGCTTRVGGGTNYLNENDRLRSDNLALEREVEELRKRIERRVQELRILEQQTTPPAVEGADVPRAVELEIGRLSGGVDTDRDASDDVVRVYLRTLDQEGRFLPVSGRATMQVVRLRANQPPQQVASTEVGPSELKQAYRSGLTGTHYSIELPLPGDLPADDTELTVHATLLDAATGAELEAQRSVKIKRRVGDASE